MVFLNLGLIHLKCNTLSYSFFMYIRLNIWKYITNLTQRSCRFLHLPKGRITLTDISICLKKKKTHKIHKDQECSWRSVCAPHQFILMITYSANAAAEVHYCLSSPQAFRHFISPLLMFLDCSHNPSLALFCDGCSLPDSCLQAVFPEPLNAWGSVPSCLPAACVVGNYSCIWFQLKLYQCYSRVRRRILCVVQASPQCRHCSTMPAFFTAADVVESSSTCEWQQPWDLFLWNCCLGSSTIASIIFSFNLIFLN